MPTLLRPQDIRTMRKDLREVKRTGISFERPLKAPPPKVATKGNLEQERDKGAQERVILDTILKQSAGNRLASRGSDPVKENKSDLETLLKDNLEPMPRAPLAPKTTSQNKESPEVKKNSTSVQMPVHHVAGVAPSKKSEMATPATQEKKRRFMEDIEKWAKNG